MLRSALGAFFVLALASLGLVSYVNAHHGTWFLARSTLAPAPAPIPQQNRQNASVQVPSAAVVPASLSSQTEITANRLGHYAADVEIDGHVVRMLVDTGATWVSLTSNDAAALGIARSKEDFKIKVSTANGVGNAAAAHLWRVRIGSVEIYDVDALVLPPGVLAQSLLGMSALRKLRSFEISAGRLVLTQ
jgi:aspartyl protease family protein